MKMLLTALTLSALSLSSALAAEGALDPAQIQTFRPYQLDTCLISGDKIGAMGEGLSLVYKGQEITFCCKMCVGQFAKKPDHFIEEMKKAEAAKAGKTEATAAPAEHAHGH